jgi:hypothetical protein
VTKNREKLKRETEEGIIEREKRIRDNGGRGVESYGLKKEKEIEREK